MLMREKFESIDKYQLSKIYAKSRRGYKLITTLRTPSSVYVTLKSIRDSSNVITKFVKLDFVQDEIENNAKKIYHKFRELFLEDPDAEFQILTNRYDIIFVLLPSASGKVWVYFSKTGQSEIDQANIANPPSRGQW